MHTDTLKYTHTHTLAIKPEFLVLAEMLTSFWFCKSVKSKDVGTQSHCSVDESKITLPSDPENNIREETVCKDKMRFDGLQPKADPQESTEISRRLILFF